MRRTTRWSLSLHFVPFFFRFFPEQTLLAVRTARTRPCYSMTASRLPSVCCVFAWTISTTVLAPLGDAKKKNAQIDQHSLVRSFLSVVPLSFPLLSLIIFSSLHFVRGQFPSPSVSAGRDLSLGVCLYYASLNICSY